LDPGAIWDGEWGRSRDEVPIVEGTEAVLRVNLGHPILTNGDFVA